MYLEMVEINYIQFSIFLIFFILSAMPLHRALKFFKKKTKFRKVILVTFISGLIISIISSIWKYYIGLISFIVLIYIYKKAFKLKWYKAFLVWLLQLIIIVISSLITELIINFIWKISLFVR